MSNEPLELSEREKQILKHCGSFRGRCLVKSSGVASKPHRLRCWTSTPPNTWPIRWQQTIGHVIVAIISQMMGDQRRRNYSPSWRQHLRPI